MMEPTNSWERDDLSVVRGLDHSTSWRVLLKPQMSAVLVEVADVRADHPAKLMLVDGDHMVEAVAPQPAYPSLGKGILPRRPEGGWDLRLAESINSAFEVAAINLVVVAEQETPRELRTRMPRRPVVQSNRLWDGG